MIRLPILFLIQVNRAGLYTHTKKLHEDYFCWDQRGLRFTVNFRFDEDDEESVPEDPPSLHARMQVCFFNLRQKANNNEAVTLNATL